MLQGLEGCTCKRTPGTTLNQDGRLALTELEVAHAHLAHRLASAQRSERKLGIVTSDHHQV